LNELIKEKESPADFSAGLFLLDAEYYFPQILQSVNSGRINKIYPN
jgi:hypothetical protein